MAGSTSKASSGPLLNPQWKRVDSFEDPDFDDDDYSEEEVSYVTLDLGSSSQNHLAAVDQAHEIQLAGLETDTPYLRVGPQVFSGQWDELIGSEIILAPQGQTDASKQTTRYDPIATTSQRITFRKVRLTPHNNTIPTRPSGVPPLSSLIQTIQKTANPQSRRTSTANPKAAGIEYRPRGRPRGSGVSRIAPSGRGRKVVAEGASQIEGVQNGDQANDGDEAEAEEDDEGEEAEELGGEGNSVARNGGNHDRADGAVGKRIVDSRPPGPQPDEVVDFGDVNMSGSIQETVTNAMDQG